MRWCLTCQRLLPIGLSGLLQPLVRHEGHLLIAEEIPDPALGDGELLIRQADRAPALAPADEPRRLTAFTLPCPRIRTTLFMERLLSV